MSMYYDKNGNPMDMHSWANKFEDREYKQIAIDEHESALVSTVWLGLDHNWGGGPPLIFETMVFGGPNDQWQERYSTLAQAEEGHQRTLKAVREGVTLWDDDND